MSEPEPKAPLSNATLSNAQLAARTYHEYMVPAMFDPWAGLLVELAELKAGERLLDVACGTGAVARRAARQLGAGGEVQALDLNPAMLEVAQQETQAPGQDAAPITWVQGSAQSLPFADASFDVVLCQHGLPFFPDRAQALAEMRRVLAPGGRLLVTVWQGLAQNPLFDALNASAVRMIGLPAYSAPFVLGEPGLLEGLLGAAGFERPEVTPKTLQVRFATPETFVARNLQASAAAIPAIAALSDAQRADLAQRMQAELNPTATQETSDQPDLAATHLETRHLETQVSGWFGRAWR